MYIFTYIYHKDYHPNLGINIPYIECLGTLIDFRFLIESLKVRHGVEQFNRKIRNSVYGLMMRIGPKYRVQDGPKTRYK